MFTLDFQVVLISLARIPRRKMSKKTTFSIKKYFHTLCNRSVIFFLVFCLLQSRLGQWNCDPRITARRGGDPFNDGMGTWPRWHRDMTSINLFAVKHRSSKDPVPRACERRRACLRTTCLRKLEGTSVLTLLERSSLGSVFCVSPRFLCKPYVLQYQLIT